MNRLWVVEACFGESDWTICNFGLEHYVSTNFYEAHKIKREQQAHLQRHGSKLWSNNKFRVREYTKVLQRYYNYEDYRRGVNDE